LICQWFIDGLPRPINRLKRDKSAPTSIGIFLVTIFFDSWYYQSMTTYQTDSRVDEYIDALPGWQQDICRRVRDLVHTADPDVSETIKRTKQPYFTLNGNICALLAAKDHVNIFIYDPIAPDPEGIINQGQGNLTARTIQVRQGETINERALLNLFKAIIANNRARGWRKLKGSQ
jgi:hypothetical protein